MPAPLRDPPDPRRVASFRVLPSAAGARMLPGMKTTLLVLSACAILGLAACGEERPSHGQVRDSHRNTANEAEKSFDKENPADPAAMQAPAP